MFLGDKEDVISREDEMRSKRLLLGGSFSLIDSFRLPFTRF